MVEGEEKGEPRVIDLFGEEKGTAEPGGKNQQSGKLGWGETPCLL